MKFSVRRCQAAILFCALFLGGCGDPQADESNEALGSGGEQDAQRSRVDYEPEALANAKADLLADVLETQRRLTRARNRIADVDNLSAAAERRIGDWLSENVSRLDSLYASARGLAIPGPSGDLRDFYSQLQSMQARRQSAGAALDTLSELLDHRGRYEKRLASMQGQTGTEPPFLKVWLPLRSGAAQVFLGRVAGQAIEIGDWPGAGELFAFGDAWLQRVQANDAIERDRAQAQIARLADRAEKAIEDDRLTTPPGNNAAEWLRQARDLDPEHPEIERLFEQVVNRYEVLARQALGRGNYRAVRAYVARVRSLPISEESENRFSEAFREAEDLARRASIAGRLEAAVEAGRRGELEDLGRQLADLREQVPDDPRLEQIEARYRVMRHLPGRVFSQDLAGDASDEGLSMIVGPRGAFMMGAERPRFSLFRRSYKDEEPRHEVNIQYPYAVSRTEVTVGQFRAFVETTGYQTDAERVGFSEVFTSAGPTRVVNRTWRHDWLGREADNDHPVVHVSWDDAQAFVSWLSRLSDEHYRLPSEAEFEVLARSMQDGDFMWDEDAGPDPLTGNFFGGGDQPPREWGREGALPDDDRLATYEDGSFGPTRVARYSANEFGFNDLIGNVSEWTQDCAHENHEGSPGNGRPRESSGDCQRRVVRGGSWISDYDSLRLSQRRLRSRAEHDSATGFRVAMDFRTERGDG